MQTADDGWLKDRHETRCGAVGVFEWRNNPFARMSQVLRGGVGHPSRWMEKSLSVVQTLINYIHTSHTCTYYIKFTPDLCTDQCRSRRAAQSLSNAECVNISLCVFKLFSGRTLAYNSNYIWHRLLCVRVYVHFAHIEEIEPSCAFLNRRRCEHIV